MTYYECIAIGLGVVLGLWLLMGGWPPGSAGNMSKRRMRSEAGKPV